MAFASWCESYVTAGGDDYTSIERLVTFEIEDEEITIPILIIGDDAVEPPEEFTVTITTMPEVFPVAVIENGTATVPFIDSKRQEFSTECYSPSLCEWASI